MKWAQVHRTYFSVSHRCVVEHSCCGVIHSVYALPASQTACLSVGIFNNESNDWKIKEIVRSATHHEISCIAFSSQFHFRYHSTKLQYRGMYFIACARGTVSVFYTEHANLTSLIHCCCVLQEIIKFNLKNFLRQATEMKTVITKHICIKGRRLVIYSNINR